jgi:hypothetical protein
MSYTYRSAAGRTYRIRARVFDPITRRFAVKVDGREVGRGFASADDAIDRGIEFCRNTEAGRGEWS